MQIVKSHGELRASLTSVRKNGQRIGFVPTMGYLHEGHLELIRHAKADNGFVVVSIFVNPLQFGPTEDLAAYPRNLTEDIALLNQIQCDVLFVPSVEDMYPQPLKTKIEIAAMSDTLCGKSRPGHFSGVATVVAKLFAIVQPDTAYFGQKDGQQVAIIKTMVNDLSLPVKIVTIPTVREPDGLAKSSRNVYLSEEERQHATVLYRALCAAESAIRGGARDSLQIRQCMREMIEAEPSVQLDYAEIVTVDSMEPVDPIRGNVMMAVAAYVGKARLIDNLQMAVDT